MSNRGRQVHVHFIFNIFKKLHASLLPSKQFWKINSSRKKAIYCILITLSFSQIVCSFLVRDMGIDWRMGAEWFETCLLDYDPCSNYGNWTYGAGDSPLIFFFFFKIWLPSFYELEVEIVN